MIMDQDPVDRAWVAQVWADQEWEGLEWADQEWEGQEWVAALGDHLHRQEEADVVAA